MVDISRNNEEYLQAKDLESYREEEKLLENIQEFNRNCKRRKGKKKHINETCKMEIDSQAEN